MIAGALMLRPEPPIEANRAAATIHEALLQATGGLAQENSAWGLIAQVLELHAPHHPPVANLFLAQNGQPVCRGCERAQHTPTRDPSWPCQTYKDLAEQLLRWDAVLLRLPEDGHGLLIVLDSYRPAGPQTHRHRSPGAVDAGCGSRARPELRLAEESAEDELRRSG